MDYVAVYMFRTRSRYFTVYLIVWLESSNSEGLFCLDFCFQQTPAVIGEDASSIERHVNVLQIQYGRMHPDTSVVKDRMARTFAWRRKEIADGMRVEDALKKYPFLGTPSGVSDLS